MWVLRMKVVINQEKKIIVYSKERRKDPNCGVGELNKLFLQLYKEELAITKNKLFTLLVEKKHKRLKGTIGEQSVPLHVAYNISSNLIY